MSYTIVSKRPEILWFENSMLGDRIDYDFYALKQLQIISQVTSMEYKKLNELLKQKRSEPQTESTDFCCEGIDVIRMSDIDDFIIDFSNTAKIPNQIYENLKEFTLKSGTIIFGLTGVTLGKAVPISENIKTCITNRRIAQLDIMEEYDSFYVATFINTKYGRNQLFRYSTGVAQPNLRLEDTGEVIIPIPSHKIQKYIGDKVRKAEKIREEAKILKVQLEILFKQYIALNYEQENCETKNYGYILPDDIGGMIGAEVYKPEYIENQRKIKRFGKFVNLNECYEYIVNGLDCRDYLDENKTPYYKVGSISMFGIKDNNRTYIGMSVKDVNDRQKINEGDLLITRKGSFGIAMAVTKKDEIGIISSEVFKLRIKNGWDADYLAYFLNSEFGKKQFDQYSTGSTMKGINQQNIVEILIPNIPYNQQIEIGELVRNIKRRMDQPKQLIKEAKQDIEELIEGNFDTSKIQEIKEN